MQVHYDTYREEAPVTMTIRGEQRIVKRYSVEVTIGNDRRRIACGAEWNDHFMLFGLALRFSQGSKVWPGTGTYWIKGNHVNSIRPNIDRSGHFILVGYFEDYADKKVRSQHNAVA